jgi:hypothetical protein
MILVALTKRHCSTRVHVVAKRCGHDPATLLGADDRRTKKADGATANAIRKKRVF